MRLPGADDGSPLDVRPLTSNRPRRDSQVGTGGAAWPVSTPQRRPRPSISPGRPPPAPGPPTPGPTSSVSRPIPVKSLRQMPAQAEPRVSPEFRGALTAWLRNFFGLTGLVFDAAGLSPGVGLLPRLVVSLLA